VCRAGGRRGGRGVLTFAPAMSPAAAALGQPGPAPPSPDRSATLSDVESIGSAVALVLGDTVRMVVPEELS